MGKIEIANFFKGVQTSLVKHSPEILTGLGVAGMITTTILAVKATPKALKLIEKERIRQQNILYAEAEEKGSDMVAVVDKIKKRDVVKATWKCYIPAAITGTVSVTCLIGASSVHAKRNAVLATAYKLSESALTEYREKVVETIGEKKEQTIREKVNKEHIEKNPVSKNDVIITGRGETLCYDHTSGRYFKSDIEKIRRAVNELNSRMLRESYVSLNDFYDELGLSGISVGNVMGWNTEMGLIDLCYDTQLSEDGIPCLVIDYKRPPKYDFDRFL